MPVDAALARNLARRLRRIARGDVLADPASRGRYAAIRGRRIQWPAAILLPHDDVDVAAAMALARELGVAVIARGADTARIPDRGYRHGHPADSAQARAPVAGDDPAIANTLVIDASRRLTAITDLDVAGRSVDVEPGVVLDQLNRRLAPHGLQFPVDIGSSAQATIGGMAGTNARGLRSLAYGDMVHNVRAIDARLLDGTTQRFGPFGVAVGPATVALQSGRAGRLVSALFELAGREQAAIDRDWPRVHHRAGGYALDIFHPRLPRPYTADGSVNLAHLLVGSEGTLAWSRRLTLALAPRPTHQLVGVVAFGRMVDAVRALRAVVALAPTSIQLVDPCAIDWGALDAAQRSLLNGAGMHPGALGGSDQGASDASRAGWLCVEFAGDDDAALTLRLRDLATVTENGAITAVCEPVVQAALRSLVGGWTAETVAGIDEAALPLAHAADALVAMSGVLHRAGYRVGWCGRVSAGTLHLQPVLAGAARHVAGASRPGRHPDDPAALVAALTDVVRAHAGVLAVRDGDGDGGSRAARIAACHGPQLTAAFGAVKTLFDPQHGLAPGGIVALPAAERRVIALQPVPSDELGIDPGPDGLGLDPGPDIAPRPGAAAALVQALAACDRNGLCRKDDDGLMCPSFRWTGLERDAPRGRVRTLQLALDGRFGPGGADALASEPVAEAFDLCVGCKGCRVECPSGIDLARVKQSVVAARAVGRPLRLRERVFGGLSSRLARIAGWPGPVRRAAVAMIQTAFGWRQRFSSLARFVERHAGLAAGRRWPLPVAHSFLAGMPAADARGSTPASPDAPRVVLFVDTLNNGFSPQVLDAALRVLKAGGYRVQIAEPAVDDREVGRPLCCGRTWLAVGRVDAARAEAARTVKALLTWVDQGVPVVGLEPACLLALRDEVPAMGIDGADRVAAAALLFAEFVDREMLAGRLHLAFQPAPVTRVLLQGHCHERALVGLGATQRLLARLPGVVVDTVPGSCCGMAGLFGYEAEHHAASLAMAGQALLPALAAAESGSDVRVLADGFDCRHQIGDAGGRKAWHVAELIAEFLPAAPQP